MKKLGLYAILSLVAVAFANFAHAYPGNPIPENVGVTNYASYAFTGFAPISNWASVPATQIVPRNTNRNLLVMQNTGTTNNIIVKPASTMHSSTDGFVIVPGAYFTPVPTMVDSFYGASQGASLPSTLTVIEGVK